ncbi:hypothetical protein H9P43_004515 [Blastocladiella emersonii ATCC 22665]|nr:hypothetical protein H9P43_004515 [Blastocladiella emersonii ATCC 22665]
MSSAVAPAPAAPAATAGSDAPVPSSAASSSPVPPAGDVEMHESDPAASDDAVSAHSAAATASASAAAAARSSSPAAPASGPGYDLEDVIAAATAPLPAVVHSVAHEALLSANTGTSTQTEIDYLRYERLEAENRSLRQALDEANASIKRLTQIRYTNAEERLETYRALAENRYTISEETRLDLERTKIEYADKIKQLQERNTELEGLLSASGVSGDADARVAEAVAAAEARHAEEQAKLYARLEEAEQTASTHEYYLDVYRNMTGLSAEVLEDGSLQYVQSDIEGAESFAFQLKPVRIEEIPPAEQAAAGGDSRRETLSRSRRETISQAATYNAFAYTPVSVPPGFPESMYGPLELPYGYADHMLASFYHNWVGAWIRAKTDANSGDV